MSILLSVHTTALPQIYEIDDHLLSSKSVPKDIAIWLKKSDVLFGDMH